MNYSELNIQTEKEYNTITFNEQEIKVLKNLDTISQYDLIAITLQKSKEDNLYNTIKVDMYFYLHLVYLYTDIIFSAQDKEDEPKLYDDLKQCGLLDLIIDAIDDEEFNYLYSAIQQEIEKNEKYNASTAAILHDIIVNMPINAAEAMRIVDTFDKTKYKEVIDFAKAANGGRPIA